MAESRIHLALLTVDLHVPAAQSLKEKRHVIRSLKDRLQNKFNISVAEVGELDKWQRVVLGISMVSNDRQHVDSAMQTVRSFIETFNGVQLVDSHLELL